MKYPNTRYGNPAEFNHHTQGIPTKELSRSERTLNDWANSRKKIPFWVPELMRLRQMESHLKFRQMRLAGYRAKIGLVKDNVIPFEPYKTKR